MQGRFEASAWLLPGTGRRVAGGVFVGSARGLPGIGDTDPPADGYVRIPKWLILGHELCGHGAACGGPAPVIGAP